MGMALNQTLAIVGFDNQWHIGTWVAAILTFCIFSFLYRDNVFYKFAEHVMVGIATGYLVVLTWWQILQPRLIDPLFLGVRNPGDEEWRIYLLVVPAVFGVFMLLRLIPRVSWISRWSMALSIGMASGLALPVMLQTRVLEQVYSGGQVPIVPPPGTPFWEMVGNWVLIVGTVASLIYFFFSKAHKGAFGGMAKIGIWVLMVGFGASFGYTVMARLSLLIGRVIFLFQDWLEFVKIT